MSTRARPVVPGWVRPVAYAAVVELITVAGTLLGPPTRPYARALDYGATALVLVSAGMVALARARPVPSFVVALATAAAYYGLGYHTDSPYFLGLLVTGYLAGGAGGRARAGVFAVGTLAVFGVLTVAGHSLDRYGGWATSVIVIAGLVAGQIAGEVRAASVRREGQARTEEARREVAEERLRIARELHDVVSHSIAMINVQASTAVHVMGEKPDQARESLNNIKAASHEALRDMRGILGLLRGNDGEDPLSPSGGVDRLPALVENVRRSGTEVTLTTEGSLPALPASVDLAAYRVVQEALTNVVRHAPGARARVAVAAGPAEVVVLVEDDGGTGGGGAGRAGGAGHLEGRGGGGHGLAGMRERVLAARGTLAAGPVTGGGFSVRAVLPVDPGRP